MEQNFCFEFRTYLRAELIERCKSNPSYSLRAFARDLQIEPSALSKIINGKRGVSPDMRVRLGKRLKLTHNQIEALALNVPQVGTYQTIAEDTFRSISDWSHFAILELTKVHGFSSRPSWIARRLGITTAHARDAIARLMRLGFLSDDKGTLKDVSGEITTTGNEFTSIALRNLQKQILRKAIHSLDEVPLEERDQTSMTMAVDSRRMPEAKRRIKEFRRELSAYLESGDQKDRVYNLAISLYPVSK